MRGFTKGLNRLILLIQVSQGVGVPLYSRTFGLIFIVHYVAVDPVGAVKTV